MGLYTDVVKRKGLGLLELTFDVKLVSELFRLLLAGNLVTNFGVDCAVFAGTPVTLMLYHLDTPGLVTRGWSVFTQVILDVILFIPCLIELYVELLSTYLHDE